MTQTVLYIEDNEVNSDIVKRILEREGYIIHICDNGPDGIQKAQDVKPDLLLVDLHLPGMNGLEITKALREIETLNDAKIMLLTADIYSREAGQEAGADEFMAKPIRRKTFLKKIHEILG
jgi:CheY-like chemotaxis protein